MFDTGRIVIILWLCAGVLADTSSDVVTKPNIILLIVDDLGWNDVGFHGSNEIPTPNIDALAYNGLILNRHYTQPTCTPSRAALMTGKYPFKLGMQGAPLAEGSPFSLPLNEKILPQYLKELGYVSRLVGKWHLGYYRRECLPISRGFDSHFGYYNGWTRYNDSVTSMTAGDNLLSGIDAWHNEQPAGERFRNKYNTDVFTEEAINIIKTHNTDKPLFLDVSYTAVHAIANSELQVRNEEENDKLFAFIRDKNRRILAGALSAVDESVGKIMEALDEKLMLNNSIVLFISDNGGATADSKGRFQNFASNWPLRGMKSSTTEGGVRGVAALWSPLVKLRNYVSNKLVHLTDWLPTFYAAAGGNVSNLVGIDGINQWQFLTGISTNASRKEILLNIDEVKGDHALIQGSWKLIRIVNSSIKYAGSSGRDEEYKYSMSNVLASRTHAIINTYANKSKGELKNVFWQMRNRAKIDKFCSKRINDNMENENETDTKCFQKGCLFNLKNDHCEYKDLSEKHKNLYNKLRIKIKNYEKSLVKQHANSFDPNSNPKYFHNYWSPWITA